MTLRCLFNWLGMSILLLGMLVAVPASPAAGPQQTLVLLTWAEYMHPEVLKAFERKYNVKVREVHYETESGLDQMLSYTAGKNYDLVVASRTKILSYIRRGWVTPVDEALVPNRKHIDAEWTRRDPEVSRYSVPYFWGGVGIAYRKDLVEGKITSWKQFYHPPQQLRGKTMMIEDVRDVVGTALKALGYSLNSQDSKELVEAEKLLLAQRPFVKKYGYMQLDENSDLIKGNYWVAMMYSGDALMLAEQDKNIIFVLPDEGTNLWLDSFTVLESSPKKKLAFQFINFLHEPENAAKLAEFLYNASPNKEARKLLPKEMLADPRIYPPKEITDKSEFYEPLPPRVLKRYNEIFSKASQGLL